MYSQQRTNLGILECPKALFFYQFRSLEAAFQTVITILYFLGKEGDKTLLDSHISNILSIYKGCSSFEFIEELKKDTINFPTSSENDEMSAVIGLMTHLNLGLHCKLVLNKNETCHCGNDKILVNISKSEIELHALDKPIKQLIFEDLVQVLSCRKCKQPVFGCDISMPKVLIIRCSDIRIKETSFLQQSLNLNGVHYILVSLIISSGIKINLSRRGELWYDIRSTFVQRLYKYDLRNFYCDNIIGAVYIRDQNCTNIFALSREQHSNIAEQHSNFAKKNYNIAGQHSNFAGQHSNIAGQNSNLAGQNSNFAEQHSYIAGQHSNLAGQNSYKTKQHAEKVTLEKSATLPKSLDESLFPFLRVNDPITLEFCTLFQFIKDAGIVFVETDARKLDFNTHESNIIESVALSNHIDDFIKVLCCTPEWLEKVKCTGNIAYFEGANSILFKGKRSWNSVSRMGDIWILRKKNKMVFFTSELQAKSTLKKKISYNFYYC